MRALLNNFDPIKQVYNRLLSLHLTGHDTDKIEMIVLGGTRDVYPTDYKREFIKWLYDACNTFPEFLKTVTLTQNANKSLFAIDSSPFEKDGRGDLVDQTEDSVQSLIANSETKTNSFSDTVEDSISINETTTHRIIWLTIETRPEYVTDENCQLWRELGITRLEIGIQSTNNEVLAMNKRWHDIACCKEACHKLRQYGFKFSVHLMPGLYGSDEQKDLQTFIDIYSDPAFKPDEIKFYPTSVIPNTELYELYKKWKYKPITTESIKNIITTTFRDIIPPYTRIKRLIRDIPENEIAAGSKITNLSQLMHEGLYKERKNTDTIRRIYSRLYENAKYYDTIDQFLDTSSEILGTKNQERGTYVIWWTIDTVSDRAFVSLDTRSREIRHRRKDEPEDVITIIREYRSTVWREFFISLETSQGYLYGFTRLLLPNEGETINYSWLGEYTALIRELHVYWQVANIRPPLSPRSGEEWKFKNSVMWVSSPEIISRAKELRKNMTPTETILRQRLNESDFKDYKRRRQHPIAQYIIDFCCVSKNIIIEIDWWYHEDPEQRELDYSRDKYLQSRWFQVLRFTNDAIINNLQDVVTSIKNVCSIPYPASDKASVGRGLGEGGIQHTWVWSTVMNIAEKIAIAHWYKKLSVIAGVGVREYYRNKLWYHNEGTYVVKEL